MIANNLVDFAARYGFDITANSDAIYGKINERPFTLYSGWNFTAVKTPLPWVWPDLKATPEAEKKDLSSKTFHPFTWEEETKAFGPIMSLLGGVLSPSPPDPSAKNEDPLSYELERQVLGEDQGFLLARTYFHFCLPSVRKLYSLVTAMDEALSTLGVAPLACLVCGCGSEKMPLMEGLAYDNLVFLHEACKEQSLVGEHPMPARTLFQTLRPWNDIL